MNGKALVTGLSGFTGHYVARELEALDYEVVGLDAGAAAGGEGDIDLRDADALEACVAAIQPDVVVHLAAQSFVAHSDVSEIYTSNIVGTRNLLHALVQNNIVPQRVILASSANVYGNAGVGVLDEDCPAQPENDYAVSKCAMEMMARCWQESLPIVVTRPFNYTGVGQSLRFLLPKLVDHFARREPVIELGNTDVYRDFSDVRFVANAYARLVAAGQPGEAYNICSGTSHSIGDALEILAELAGYRIKVETNPAFVRANEVKHLTGCNQRLAGAIGELRTIGLADTLDWMYRAQTAT